MRFFEEVERTKGAEGAGGLEGTEGVDGEGGVEGEKAVKAKGVGGEGWIRLDADVMLSIPLDTAPKLNQTLLSTVARIYVCSQSFLLN